MQGEDFYRQLAEQSPDAMWVHSQGIIVYVNRACVAFFGASSADELLGKNPLDFVHPDDREIVKQKIHELYYERKPVLQDQARWIRLDGAAVYAEIVARPIEYQGEAGAQVTFRDVSERRQIEQNLRKSEASLAAAQRIAHLGSWEIDFTNLNDLDKYPPRWSDEIFRILGYEPGQIQPSRNIFLQSLHPDDRERLQNALVSALHEKKSLSADYRIILPNGSQRIVHSQGEFVFDKNTHRALKLVGTIQDITAQKKADEKFRALLEAAPDAMIVTNQEGKIVLVNMQTEKLFGYKREELLNNTIEILMPERFRGRHHDDRTGFSADPQVRLMGAGRQLFALRKDGSEFPVEISLGPLETEEGVLVTSAIRDITGQIRAEEELLRYEAIVQWSNDAIIGLTLDGIITNWNMGAERMFGFSRSEAVGKPIAILAPSDRREEPLEFVDRMKKGESVLHFETVRVRKDGKLIDVSITLSPIRNRNGEILGGSGIVRDITELRRAEERFHKAFDASPEPMTIAVVSNGRYIDVNESFLRVTGYRRGEVIGRTSLELGIWNRPEDRATLVKMVENKGVVRDFEMAFRTKNGEQRAGLASFEAIEFAGQRCVIAIVKDVTERRKLEEQLRKAQRMEAIGQLAGGIAHDFNNVLNVIFGYSDLLIEDIGSDESHLGKIQEIKKAAQRAASLVQQLLAFSRKQVLEPRAVNLNDILQDIETMLRRVMGEDIELLTRADPSVGTVKVDPGQMEQVILNLAINARDALPRGGKLTVETANVTLDAEYFRTHDLSGTPGAYVLLSVSDTGMGMDEATQKRIFEPFFTTKGAGKGTGLGLSTVYGIVKQSGGYIWVYSEPDRGTTFRIYLPRVDEMPEAPAAATLAQEETKGTETILIVEDEEALCALLYEYLLGKGYTVLKAHTGSEAIQIAERHPGPIELLITDVIMPGMSGPELAGQLAASRPGTKVLFVSGYTQNALAPHGVLEPGIAFLQKPYKLREVARKIRSLLQS
jgi:two-component system cell cycle sensor histidine kinase/response regulator CckA